MCKFIVAATSKTTRILSMLVLLVVSGNAYAQSATTQKSSTEQSNINGVNSIGDQLPIGAGGKTVLTLTGSTQSSAFSGPVSIGSTNVACTSANAGSIRYNTSVTPNQFEGCNGTAWAVLGKPNLVQTETISCAIGAGEPATDCVVVRSGSTEEVQQTSSAKHDLCTIDLAAGWAGGFWGACALSGTPGNTWTIDTANYQNQQISCTANCYDFQ